MKARIVKVTPFIIGLTGAIGTGKSLVRKMLEHKGALSVDADQLAHGAYAQGTTGFHAIVRRFGNEILDKAGQIDRKRLGELVFKNPQALIELETLIHPLVTQAVNQVIDLSPLPIIVVEAIKLFETDLKERCDVVWAVSSPAADIYQRLSETRGMDRTHVDERFGNQSNQIIDETQVDTTILNQGNISDLWAVISARWDDLLEKSRCFSAAFTRTGELIKPFQKHLIQPGDAIQAQAISEINKNGLFFLSAKNLNAKNLQSSAADFDPSCLEKASYQYFLWGSEDTPENILYLISDMDNFTATATVSASQFDMEQFIKIISMAQDFSRLHMCEKFFFPFNKESTPLSDELGFYKYFDVTLPTAELSPLGYNLLCKQLRPPLDLFREN
ncbi:MAG: dephospho-CoA kinase [Pelolinea sp.]|nr:dephospho-CoA kinase [Pelolinea sp.]